MIPLLLEKNMQRSCLQDLCISTLALAIVAVPRLWRLLLGGLLPRRILLWVLRTVFVRIVVRFIGVIRHCLLQYSLFVDVLITPERDRGSEKISA